MVRSSTPSMGKQGTLLYCVLLTLGLSIRPIKILVFDCLQNASWNYNNIHSRMFWMCRNVPKRVGQLCLCVKMIINLSPITGLVLPRCLVQIFNVKRNPSKCNTATFGALLPVPIMPKDWCLSWVTRLENDQSFGVGVHKARNLGQTQTQNFFKLIDCSMVQFSLTDYNKRLRSVRGAIKVKRNISKLATGVLIWKT